MLIVKKTADLTANPRGGTLRGGAIALGNFDGMHLGHHGLLARLVAKAKALNIPAGVLTFEPHPRSVFRPEGEFFRLTLPSAKQRLLAACGMDYMWEQKFDRAFSQQTAAAFIDNLLVNTLAVRHVTVGEDFHFGHDRAGDVTFLRAAGEHHGFSVEALSPLTATDGTLYSASRIRALLQAGDASGAAALLGRPWEIEAKVIVGDQRGRELGFPTANLELSEHLRPAYGVYAVMIGVPTADRTDRQTWHWHRGVANIGRRPTIDGTTVRLEAHLFDATEDLYGKPLRVALIDFIRPEQKFAGLAALKQQITQDAARARVILQDQPSVQSLDPSQASA